MIFVYVLDNIDNTNRYYVGMTDNFERRINCHYKGICKTSSKLGDPSKLRCFHIWTTDDYVSGSKLERFCHQQQKKFGDEWLLELITEMPIYTNNHKEIIKKYMPTTPKEYKMCLLGKNKQFA
jgi:predicted GIY-YIG superfamily endonuclease